MIHRLRRLVVLAALSPPPLSQLACSRTDLGELYVALDSTRAAGTVEVVALPFDPAERLDRATAPPRAAAGDPRSDSVSRFVSLRDSAVALDAAFRRVRAALNREALALRLDTARRARAYAARYDAWSARAAAAAELRARRDRARAGVARFRAHLGPDAPPDPPAPPSRILGRAAVDSAARSSARVPVRATASRGSATLRLAAGRWWITTGTRDGVAVMGAAPVEVRRGERDTVRLGEP